MVGYLERLPTAGRAQQVDSIDMLNGYVQYGYNTLVILDVDETIIATDIINGKKQKVLVEAKTPRVIRKIRQDAPDARIILLTKASKKDTKEKLKNAGLDPDMFDSIESASGTKGASLKQYVDKNFQETRHICFIDDTLENLESVESACKDLGIHCNTFLFTGAEAMIERTDCFNYGMTPDELHAFKRAQEAAFATYKR
ncbi:DUF2608 domain-containing protein [Endozoicomonas atrinae]|uniref:DUF2608 domain-containing protein n=1 Tax=Endozoicomonas atrinae TaxID=1333660 RepID=UPI003B008BF2